MIRSAAARAGLAISLGAMGIAVVLWVVGVDEPFTPEIALYPLAYLAFAAVGALIVGRQPANRIGRLCMLTGILGSVVAAADSYARLAAPVPGQPWAMWLTSWGFPTTFAPILAVLLLFPNGRLASRRWTVVAWLVATGVMLVTIGAALTPEFADFSGTPNPMGQEWIVGTIVESGGVGWLLILGGAISAAAGLVLRLRRSSGVERQQLKLVTFAAALNGISWLVLALDLPGTAGEVATYAVFATVAAVPLAIGVAMLRYRLYEVDLVIRRTLVYGALSVVLLAVYVALILGLQAILAPVTANNGLAVALSTLTVAALFGPARRRVQAAVDRRFYRSRYDAQRTLAHFAADLRNEVDLAALTAELQRVAVEALQPVSASVWLRERAP